MIPKLEPAPVGRRLLAGLLDATLLVALSFAAFGASLLIHDFALPTWGVLLVCLGASVVPLALFGRTPGLALFGLSLLNREGQLVDPINLAFRELLGRALVPAAYLLMLAAGATSTLLGLFAFVVPTELSELMAWASAVALLASALGQLRALVHPSRRGLPDLIAGSVVVVTPPAPQPASRRRAWAALVATELALVLVVLGTPWLLTHRGGERASERALRMKRKTIERRFAEDPGNVEVAKALSSTLELEGAHEEARRVRDRHDEVIRAGHAARVEALRALLRDAPGEQRAAMELVELLQSQGALEQAAAVFRAYAEANHRREAFLQLALWLESVGMSDEARAARARVALFE